MNPAPARRVLHVCWCCDDDEPVVGALVEGLGLRNTMSTPLERSDGSLLGIAGEIEGRAAFVFDARGPRTSPALEVQRWVDPAVTGRPPVDPSAVGIQALGVAVPNVGATVARLRDLGWDEVTGSSPVADGGTIVRDPAGVTVDLTVDVAVPAEESRLRHLRVTVADLDRSLPWYERIGFEVLDTTSFSGAAWPGLDGDGDVARLRLPDEPFEVLLVGWRRPPAHGRHPREANHAGLYRVALGVDDTRSAHADLAAAGWAFDAPPVSVELRGTPVPDMWICFTRDPDGVPYELVQRPRSAFRP